MSTFIPVFSFAGQQALVTGCSRDIGQGMAVRLAEVGADVIGVSPSSSGQ